MVLKLYGYPHSITTKRVAVVLYEKKVPFELHIVDLAKGEHKSEGYAKIQPWGQVPYIDDDGFILYESRAIARYIVEKYAAQGTPLQPPLESNFTARGLFEQVASAEVANFDAFAGPLVVEIFYKPMRGVPADDKEVKKKIEKLSETLQVYDGILAKQRYLNGESISMIDLFHLPCGAILMQVKPDIFSKHKNVIRWWEEISSRESWKAVGNVLETQREYAD
ncbi:glutathione S-transferase [Flagelloscypha sp. PMI_526]|nr:glutathione S-transferase [Flagelloscypha sp. PMI_526]